MTDARPFPSYKHSGAQSRVQGILGDPIDFRVFGVADGCCNSCLENQCTSNFAASYDTSGAILVPTEDNLNWTNTSPPGKLHPIPCAYTVTVAGITNFSVNTSWCQSCGNLNGTYYMRLPRAPAGQIGDTYYGWDESYFGVGGVTTWSHIECLGLIPLCSEAKPIGHCGFTNLIIFLMIGQVGSWSQWWKPYSESAVAPQWPVDKDYVYRNDNRVAEGRPQLKIFGVARFEIPRYGTTSVYGDPDIDGYVYVTEIADFNGDYKYHDGSGGGIVSGFTGNKGIIPFSDTKEGSLVRPTIWGGGGSVPTKVYHGDFDGENLSFTISGADRIFISPGEEFNVICNLDGMTISVSPLEDTYPNTVDSYRPFRGFLSEDFGNTYLVGDLLTQALEGDTWVDGITGEIRETWPGWGFLCNSWTGAGRYTDPDYYGGTDWYNPHGRNAPMPEWVYVTISGTSSTNPDNEDKYACNDAEDLNGEHALQILGYPQLSGWAAGLYVYFRDPIWYKTLEKRLCCQCDRANSACISALKLAVEKGSDSTVVKLFVLRVPNDYGYYDDPYEEVLAIYELEFGHQERLTIAAINGATLNLTYTNEDYADEVTFGSTATINVSPLPDGCDCLTSRECAYCATETQPLEVIATPSDELTMTNVCTQNWGCPTDDFSEAGVGDEAVLSLGSINSNLFNAQQVPCSWINVLYWDVEVWPGIGSSTTGAWYEFTMTPIVGEYTYTYPWSGTTVTYEDVMLLQFHVAVTHRTNYWQTFVGIYHDTIPLPTKLDDRGYWMDCNFNHTLNWVGWTFYGSFSPYFCCWPKVGDSVDISVEA